MSTTRYYYIDFLRVIAILMMFIFHVSMVFVTEWGWHIKNADQSNVLLELNYWMSSFRMPLLFFVSGYISYILMQRMTWKSFSIQRFQRLIIPTIIWTFVLVAPQIYFERLHQGQEMNYWTFYASFLQFEWYPEGNFHWLHLWFIPYLFIYNLLSIPLVYLLERRSTRSDIVPAFIKLPFSPLLFALIAILPYTFLSVHYEASYDIINDIARHSYFFFFIIAGLIFFKFQEILIHLESNRSRYLRLALLSITTINVIRWNGWEPYSLWDNWIEMPQTYLYIALNNLNSWLWVFTCLGYGRKYLNHQSALLTYANTAVYPFYILHQTVIVIIAYYVVQTNDDTTLKFGFLLFVCFWLTVLIYHLFVKPYDLMRYLFGMKKKAFGR